MDILTCFQAAPDLSSVYEEDWEQISKAPADGCFARIFDCFDETALEMALTLRDEYDSAGDYVRLRAVTLSAASDDRLYERLFALGYDSVIRLDFDAEYLCAPNVKAAIIADHVKKTGIPDLIFCGIQSGIGGSRMTGPMIAERLGLPCIGDVSRVRRAPDNELFVEISGDGVCSTGRISGKAIVLAGNAQRGLLRTPTLKARLAVKGKRAEVVEASAPDVFASVYPDSVRRLPLSRGRCRFIEGDMAAKAETVLKIWKGRFE